MGIEALIIGAVAATAAVGITKAVSGGGDKGGGGTPAPIPTPQAPSAEEAAAKAQDTARKIRGQSTQTLYTDPLGSAGQANIAKTALKDKLGQ